MTQDLWNDEIPKLDKEEVEERLRMLEKNRHMRERIDMVKRKRKRKRVEGV